MSIYTEINFKEVESTNSYALSNLVNLADGTIITAEVQTAGRGQFKRKWVSDNAGNLYLSIVLKPIGINPDKLKEFSLYMARTCCLALQEYLPKEAMVTIKEPNDILVNNKKLAGILTETIFQGNLQGLVLGIGINLNMTDAELKQIDQPATSLNILITQEIDKVKFKEKLLQLFFRDYAAFLVQVA